MADLKLVTIPPPFNGMNSVASPGKCPEGQGPLVENFLVHVPGKLPMRGPVQGTPYAYVDTNATLAAPNILTGAWSFDDKVLVGFMAKSATAYMPPWILSYFRPSESKFLAEASTTAALIDVKAGTITKVTLADDNQAPCNRGARLEKYVYGYGFGRAATNTTEGVIRGLRRLLRWDGTSTAPTVYEHGVTIGQDIKSYLNRIFVLGGAEEPVEEFQNTLTGDTFNGSKIITNPTPWTNKGENAQWKIGDTIKGENIPAETTITDYGYGPLPAGEKRVYISKAATGTKSGVKFETQATVGRVFQPSTLFWTRQGGPITDSNDQWKDDVSGLANKIIIGDDDRNDFGVALAVVGQTLIIFKRHSIWALYGYSPSTFQVKNLTTERGCVDQMSVYEDDGGVYFMSQHGLEFFNGTEFALVDERVANITRPAAAFHAGEKGVHDPATDFGRITVNYIGNNYLFVSFSGQNPNTAVKTSQNWSGYMHTETGNWAEFSTDAWSSQEVPLYNGITAMIPWMWDGRQLNPVPWLTEPETAVNAGLNQVDKTLAGTVKGIPAKYWSDRIPLATPGYTSQLHRFLFDYRFPNGATDAAAENGWFLTVFKSKSDEQAITETQVPGQAELPATKYLSGRRWEKDVFEEAIDCRVQVEWKSSLTTNVKLAEVYDSTLELQVARQRRST